MFVAALAVVIWAVVSAVPAAMEDEENVGEEELFRVKRQGE